MNWREMSRDAKIGYTLIVAGIVLYCGWLCCGR